ncbi:MAG: WYL domain-containing protein [Lachnospiraceae bacterium]|nr:WYL domain-containing protein [Lachnospiraceae bacterium]
MKGKVIIMSERDEAIENIINGIQDCPLRVTLQMLYILMNEPEKYTLRDISVKLGYNLTPAISTFLDQNTFEFYAGNTMITRENEEHVLRMDSEEKLFVITRVEFWNQHGFEVFRSLMEDYKSAFPKKKSFEEIVTFNSYMIADSTKEFKVDQAILQLLSDKKTEEYELSPDGSRFHPIAVYKSRQNDREYFVALKKVGDRDQIKFYPCDKSQRAGNPSVKSVLISDVYPDSNIVNKAREKLKLIWGPNDMYLDEEEFEVSAIIYDKSCVGKIRHDISNSIHRLVEKDDRTYLLKLKVLGYNVFRKWALSYGSSIEIKEPLELRDDLIRTFGEIRKRYT